MKSEFRILLVLIALLSAMIIHACGDDDDDDDDTGGGEEENCQDIYDAGLASQCMGYDYFEYYGCTDDDITDPACFIDCVDALVDGEDLCYDAEQCVNSCSVDDASGCMNAYSGMPNEDCIEYKDYFKQACDQRVDVALRNCVASCFDSEEDCDSFFACVDNCTE